MEKSVRIFKKTFVLFFMFLFSFCVRSLIAMSEDSSNFVFAIPQNTVGMFLAGKQLEDLRTLEDFWALDQKINGATTREQITTQLVGQLNSEYLGRFGFVLDELSRLRVVPYVAWQIYDRIMQYCKEHGSAIRLNHN